MVAFPPGPFTSIGLWVERAESFRAIGLKLGVYSTLWVRGQRSAWEGEGGFRCLEVEDERSGFEKAPKNWVSGIVLRVALAEFE